MKKIYFILIFLFTLNLNAQQYKMPAAYVKPSQPSQSGFEVEKCNDNDNNTIYHSNYILNTAIPDQLEFGFSNRVKSIKRLIYKPRSTGNNGIWTKVRISYSTKSQPYVFNTIPNDILLQNNNLSKTIDLPTEIVEPAIIRVNVLSAQNNFSSCAEMEFYSMDELRQEVQQECNAPVAEFSVFSDIPVIPQITGSAASVFQSGKNIENSFDGNINTVYNSATWGTSAVFPISLTYRFSGQQSIDYLRYIPRQDGLPTGLLGNVKISFNTVSNPNYTLLATHNFRQVADKTIVSFPFTVTPLNIKIEVLDGKNNFASCAEMEFFKTYNPFSDYSGIFTDSLFSELKPNVTQQSINTITSPFFKSLAQCLFNGTYNKKYRVQTFSPYRTIESINEKYKIWNYNFYENPTGIVFKPNSIAAIFVKDLKNPAYLMVRDFATEGNSSPESKYPLKNGLNILTITNTGLGYISYYTNDVNAIPVTVNIASGSVNGIYKKGTTSSEWIDIANNGVYPKVDLEGHYTKLVIDKAPVSQYNYFDVQPLIDKYDMITKSQREMMGFFKFNKNIKNRQFINVESTGGWFAGNNGVHLDLTWGPKRIALLEELNVWAIPHELGHINQIRPGLNWQGSTEITNNIYSAWAYYNLYIPTGSNRFTQLEEATADKTAFPKVKGNRFGEFIIQTQINEKNLMYQHTVNYETPIYDANFRSLIPFWQLELYYQLAGASRGAATLAFDLDMSDESTQTYPNTVSGIDYAHWHAIVAEKVRNTDESQLTQGQILMNFVKNTCDAVQEDLTDFFTKTGFLRPIDDNITQYGTTKAFTVTQSMIDDTKAYIASKGYVKPISPVINYLSAHSLTAFKNLLPVSGVTGIGAQVTSNTQGQFLLIDNSKWKNAVAFETYSQDNQLISVSIVGTGDTTLLNTYVDFPTTGARVYAVGYNGQKILVYPANTVCYKPGTIATTERPALATKIGMSSLTRNTADSSNWPAIRTGGWLALEARTKGFVPNRVPFDSSGNPIGITQSNFIEGMLVYDTTNKCLKMYTSKDGEPAIGWYCITTQTCPD